MSAQNLRIKNHLCQDKNILYKKGIWLYLILLIFEGALRKWFLPAFATPLLVVRDPIVVWLVWVGFQKGWLKNGYAIAMMVVSTISLLLTLLIGHQNLWTALFGWRIYFFYFPFIFVMGKILTRDDLLKMGRFILYLSIPMTLLMVVQFYSPQSAWVNRGIGGDMEGAGFSGALGYFRPPGTFSFISGYVMFQLVTACFLAYYLLKNNDLEKSQQIKPWILWMMLVCYLISIPTSVSRSHFFQTAVVLFFMLTGSFWLKRQFSKKIIQFIILLGIGIGVLLLTGIVNESMAAFIARFESASASEGGIEGTLGKRYLGGFLRGLYNEDLPFWGYGLGLGTKAGSGFFNLGIFGVSSHLISLISNGTF
jgi:hypothetical protein